MSPAAMPSSCVGWREGREEGKRGVREREKEKRGGG